MNKMQATYLTRDSVSILQIINGENHRKAYVNSASGRAELTAECPPEVVAEVLEAWGEAPTVEEIVAEEMPASQPVPTLEDRVADMEMAMTEMAYGGDAV